MEKLPLSNSNRRKSAI